MATKILTQEVGQVLANKIKANTTAITGHQSSITTMQSAIAALQAGTYDDTELRGKVTANETAIATLNGTGAGSVQKTVDDRIAEVVANAPADFDTLKEISDWISGHANDASAMNSQIQGNTTSITAVQSSITTLQTAVQNLESNAMSVDAALSATSENPVQNKAVKAAIDAVDAKVDAVPEYEAVTATEAEAWFA